MEPEDWDAGFGRAIGVFLNGNGIRGRDARGGHVSDLNFLLYFNAADEAVKFELPHDEYAPAWQVLIDTAGSASDSQTPDAGSAITVEAKTLMVLTELVAPETEPDHSVAASLASLADGHLHPTTAAPSLE
jgi:glycogen operon protein